MNDQIRQQKLKKAKKSYQGHYRMQLELAIAQTSKEAAEITGIMFAATLVVDNRGTKKSSVLPSLFEFGNFFSQVFGESKWVEIEKTLVTKGGWKGTLQGDSSLLSQFFGRFN